VPGIFGGKGGKDGKDKPDLKLVKERRGKHRAPQTGEKFDHPDLRGETDPAKIKKILDDAKADNKAEMERIIRDTHGR
jgi:hypothetical protein